MLQITSWKFAVVALLTSTLMFVERTAFAQPAPQYVISAVDLEISPDHLQAFIAAVKENAAATIQEAGCRQYDVIQSTTNPHQISIYEVYENDAAVQAHRASGHFKKYLATTGKMVVKRQSRPMTSVARHIKPN